jgi:hypothetical protein
MPLSSKNNNPSVTIKDSANLDAFSRLRTSGPVTLFDYEAEYGDSDLIWETDTLGGSVSNSLDESSIVLSNGDTTSGNYAIRQTKVYYRYMPGYSLMILNTFVLGGLVENVTKQIGYYDGYNGIFLKCDGNGYYIVKRSSASGFVQDTSIPQEFWNLDRMDGTGKSGITIDFTKTQIMVMDLQWLGVGRVRFGFDIDGKIYYVHEFLHANNLDEVYMATANLPIRAEIENTGVAGDTETFKHICSSIISEGGFEANRAFQFSSNTGATATGVTTRQPILTIRAARTGPNGVTNTGQIIFKAADIIATTNSCLYEIVLNGSLTSASFSKYDSDYSLAEIDTDATAISGGIVLDSGYIAADSQGNLVYGGGTTADIFRKIPLVYTQLNGEQETISVVITSVTGTSDVNASIVWQEFY